MRTPHGLKWAVPVALVAPPAYLFAMNVCTVLAQRPGLGWPNVLVLLFAWNAMKFAWMAVLSVPMMLRHTIARPSLNNSHGRSRFLPRLDRGR